VADKLIKDIKGLYIHIRTSYNLPIKKSYVGYPVFPGIVAGGLPNFAILSSRLACWLLPWPFRFFFKSDSQVQAQTGPASGLEIQAESGFPNGLHTQAQSGLPSGARSRRGQDLQVNPHIHAQSGPPSGLQTWVRSAPSSGLETQAESGFPNGLHTQAQSGLPSNARSRRAKDLQVNPQIHAQSGPPSGLQTWVRSNIRVSSSPRRLPGGCQQPACSLAVCYYDEIV
jgi:hypothetical protein